MYMNKTALEATTYKKQNSGNFEHMQTYCFFRATYEFNSLTCRENADSIKQTWDINWQKNTTI